MILVNEKFSFCWKSVIIQLYNLRFYHSSIPITIFITILLTSKALSSGASFLLSVETELGGLLGCK